jgi:hypothetical protein
MAQNPTSAAILSATVLLRLYFVAANSQQMKRMETVPSMALP